MRFKFDKELPRIRRARKTKVKGYKIEEVNEQELRELLVRHDKVGRDVARHFNEVQQGQISLGETGGYSGELEEY